MFVSKRNSENGKHGLRRKNLSNFLVDCTINSWKSLFVKSRNSAVTKWTTKNEQIKDKLSVERIDEGKKIAGRLFSDFRDYLKPISLAV